MGMKPRSKNGPVWCVSFADNGKKQWCAVKHGRKPAETTTQVPTKCSQWIVLPGGSQLRTPTCDDCRKAVT
jgi:hypothetical protein